jgi:hypothetical protein
MNVKRSTTFVDLSAFAQWTAELPWRHRPRGKIILLRRFEAGRDVCFDLTYWPEYAVQKRDKSSLSGETRSRVLRPSTPVREVLLERCALSPAKR